MYVRNTVCILTPFACGVLNCGAHFGACIPGIAFFPRHRLYTLKSLQVGKTRHLSAEQRIYTQTISFTKMCVKIVRFLRGCLESAAGRRKRLYHLTYKRKIRWKSFFLLRVIFPPLSEPQTEAWNSNATFSPPSMPPPCLQNCGEFLFWFLLHTNIFVLWWTAIFSLVLVSEILHAAGF